MKLYLNVPQAPNSGLDIIPLLSFHRPQLGLGEAGEIRRRHRRRGNHGSKEGRHRRHGRESRRGPGDCLRTCTYVTHTTHIVTHSNERFLYLLCRFSFLPPIIDLIRIQFLPISHLWERRGSWKKEPVPGIRSGIRPI